MLLALLFLTAAHAQDANDPDGDATKKPPATTQVAGSWSGTDDVNDGGSGDCTGCPMTLDIMQNRSKLSGTFSLGTGDENPSGPFNGTIKGDAIHATFHATIGAKHACTAEVAASVDGNQMTGTFVVHGNKQHCGGTRTFTLTKQ